MIRVFSGDNRLEAERAIQTQLGANYEVFEGTQIEITDLPSIFQGTMLFGAKMGEKRRILLKDVGENPAVWEKIADYLDTEYEVIIWETKLDKRSAGYKRLKEAGIELRDFPAKKPPEAGLAFNILDTALRDGQRAVEMCEKIELTQDPYMFFGLLVTQALKKFDQRPTEKGKRLLKALAKLDLQMKTTSLEPWLLVKSFLLEVSQI